MSTALSLRRNPVSLVFSTSLWVGVGYLFTYLFVAWGLFAVALIILVGGALLSLTLAGLPVLIAVAALIRGCANFERARLRTVDPGPVAGAYREVTGSGAMATLRARWRDPAIWHDIAYLFGMLVPLWILDFGVLTIWLTLLAGITLPAWYWAPRGTGSSVAGFVNNNHEHGVAFGYFPHGPAGPGAVGLFVHTLPTAFLAAAAFAVAFLLFNYVLVATARMHGRVARALLGPLPDPLAAAQRVLSEPGPLGRLIDRQDV
jgi:hypothetical protein